MIIKQGSGLFRQFLMVLSSDGVTGATGKTVTVKLGKNTATGVNAFNTPAIEVDSVNLPGIYYIALSSSDTGSLGDLVVRCTASGCNQTTFIDQVQNPVFTDLNVVTGGRVQIANNLQQNTALNGFVFLMVKSTDGTPATGLTVTAQRSLGGAGFGPCANSVSEIGNGLYTINLAATDLNSATVMLRFTAATASDLNIQLIPTP